MSQLIITSCVSMHWQNYWIQLMMAMVAIVWVGMGESLMAMVGHCSWLLMLAVGCWMLKKRGLS